MASAIKLIYLLIACLHIVLFYFVSGDSLALALTKSVLMPLLLILIYFYRKESQNKANWTKVIIAVCFSFLGDIFLLNIFEQDYFFLAGLTCFLITHGFYISIFSKDYKSFLSVFKIKNILPTVMLLTWILSFYFYIDSYLGELGFPVLIYMIVIGIMALAALSRKAISGRESFLLVMMGAILFMISDMILALNKFAFPIEYSSSYIMATYLLAQFLIVEGLFREYNRQIKIT